MVWHGMAWYDTDSFNLLSVLLKNRAEKFRHKIQKSCNMLC